MPSGICVPLPAKANPPAAGTFSARWARLLAYEGSATTRLSKAATRGRVILPSTSGSTITKNTVLDRDVNAPGNGARVGPWCRCRRCFDVQALTWSLAIEAVDVDQCTDRRKPRNGRGRIGSSAYSHTADRQHGGRGDQCCHEFHESSLSPKMISPPELTVFGARSPMLRIRGRRRQDSSVLVTFYSRQSSAHPFLVHGSSTAIRARRGQAGHGRRNTSHTAQATEATTPMAGSRSWTHPRSGGATRTGLVTC